MSWTMLSLRKTQMMTKAGRQRMRWKQSRTTVSSPSLVIQVTHWPFTNFTWVSYVLNPLFFFLFFFFVCPGSVFCVSLDPASNTLAVTGGEDDKAYVWRVSDGEVLFECTGKYQIHLMITIKNVTFLVCWRFVVNPDRSQRLSHLCHVQPWLVPGGDRRHERHDQGLESGSQRGDLVIWSWRFGGKIIIHCPSNVHIYNPTVNLSCIGNNTMS